jgi:hypothetical protein
MADSRESAPNEGEATSLATTAEVAAVVQGVQRKHRGRIQWSVGRHTAEMALRAIGAPPHERPRPSSKSRRRKRFKRML